MRTLIVDNWADEYPPTIEGCELRSEVWRGQGVCLFRADLDGGPVGVVEVQTVCEVNPRTLFKALQAEHTIFGQTVSAVLPWCEGLPAQLEEALHRLPRTRPMPRGWNPAAGPRELGTLLAQAVNGSGGDVGRNQAGGGNKEDCD